MAITIERLAALTPSLSEEVASLAYRVRAGVVAIESGRGGGGSGTIWDEAGVVVTNHHVVSADTASVTLADGRRFRGEVFRRDPKSDLAALRVPSTGLPAVPVGDSRRLRPGQLVIAVGNPLGVRGAATLGTISSTPGRAGGGRFSGMVQAAISLYPGNSGGPLVDAAGRVVGINAMVTGPGLALAVPSHLVQRLLGAVPGGRAYLGATLRTVEVPAPLASSLGLRAETAVMVLGVGPGSPAERAGLLPGDLLLAADGVPAADAGEFAWHLGETRPGLPVHLRVARAGGIVNLVATTGELRVAA